MKERNSIMNFKSLSIAAIGAMLLSVPVYAKELRLSHQWSTKDVRHKFAQILADHVESENVGLKIKIFENLQDLLML